MEKVGEESMTVAQDAALRAELDLCQQGAFALPPPGDSGRTFDELKQWLLKVFFYWRRAWHHPGGTNGGNRRRARWVVACSRQGCMFRFHMYESAKTGTAWVKVAEPHSCTAEDHAGRPTSSYADASVVRSCFLSKANAFAGKPSAFRKALITMYGVDIGVDGAKRMLKDAPKATTYKSLDSWATMAQEMGYSVDVDWVEDREQGAYRFRRMFLASKAMSDTVLHSLPVLCLDGAHLHGEDTAGGCILSCTTPGPSEQRRLLVVAVGVCSGESSANWSWFLKHLHSSNPDAYG